MVGGRVYLFDPCWLVGGTPEFSPPKSALPDFDLADIKTLRQEEWGLEGVAVWHSSTKR